MFPGGNLLTPTSMYQGMFRASGSVPVGLFESLQAAARERNQVLNQALAFNAPFLGRPLPNGLPAAPLLIPMGVDDQKSRPSQRESNSTSPAMLSPHERGHIVQEQRPKSCSPPNSPPPSSGSGTTMPPKLKFGINSILSSDISSKKEKSGKSHFGCIFA